MRFGFVFVGALAIASAAIAADTALKLTPIPVTNAEWEKPYPAFHIAANLYYVGTYDLGCFLITTPEGHILINSGVASSVPMIKASVEQLGFKFSDIKIITATHGHQDHVSGLGEIKRMTGATMYIEENDLSILETGGNYDYRRPEGRGLIFEPVKVEHPFKDGDKIRLGNVELTAHLHAGHTKGATSFTYTAQENGQPVNIAILNMATVNEGVRLVNQVGYPNIAEDYAKTFAAQKLLHPDVWVGSHAGQFDLHERHKPGDSYDPKRFSGGYQEKIAEYEKAYLARLARDKAAAQP